MNFVAACVFFGIASAEPIFPGGTASVASKIAATVRAAASSSASGAGGNLQKVVAAGKAQLIEDAAIAMRSEQIANDAYLLAHANLMRVLNVGSCPRDYSSCPSGWGLEGQICVPPAEYAGFCGATDLTSFEVSKREQFAQTCEAPFPCQDSCQPNFSSCPTGWSREGENCVATSDYKGICSSTSAIAGLSDSSKASWAAMCGTSFPCA
jgi:CPW-WPC domain-containing protein